MYKNHYISYLLSNDFYYNGDQALMNSTIEVSQNIIAIAGTEKPSEFRLNQLRQSISLEEAKNIESREIYFCELDQDLTSIPEEEIKELSKLLSGSEEISFLNNSFFLITPRIGTISPWSSKATEITNNCGFDFIKRIEKGTCYFTQKSIDSLILKKIGDSFADRMTQEVILSLDDISKLFSNLEPGSLSDIDIVSNTEALKQANIELGLALSNEEISYLYESYSKTNKDPTDAELMMFAQANSEHCRHKIFNADWTIDGKKNSHSLFDMIRNTYKNYSEGIISAYEDNAAILSGNIEKRFYPQDGKYASHQEEINLVIKVETHNHPTAISPFSGASTGSGGEIRDEGATGIGA
ncbi:MAG: phosphoribosylformylglycinamidine synthase, partial [Gammaproteobacteria bacterium]